jgi:hypothetical protein
MCIKYNMVKRHHSKKTHRKRTSHHRRRHTRRRGGGGHGGLGGGSAYTSGASQVLKQMAPAPLRGGMRSIGRTLKRLLHL